MKFLIIFSLFTLLLSSGLISASPPVSKLLPIESAIKDEPITIIINDWASQKINSFVIGSLFEKLNLTVQYKVMSVDSQWDVLANNENHIQVEIWEGTMADDYHRLISQHNIIDAGSYTAVSREEWWYPEYVEALCPGLPDWKALLNCSSVFSKNNKTPDKGIYLTGPWDDTDELRIEALGLSFAVERVKSDKELWEELKLAYEEKKPILLLNWTPNYINNLYDGDFIEFPDYSEHCRIKPEWGENPKVTHDCGNPKQAWIKKITTKQFKETHPQAFALLEKFDLTSNQFSEMIYIKEVLGISEKRVADIWLSKNKKIWEKWLLDK